MSWMCQRAKGGMERPSGRTGGAGRGGPADVDVEQLECELVVGDSKNERWGRRKTRSGIVIDMLSFMYSCWSVPVFGEMTARKGKIPDT